MLRDRCRYHVVGLVTDQERDRLKAVARAVSFHGLEIAGEVSNEVLRAQIEAADMICCLRWPVLEGGSASAIEAMLSGRPVIVTDAGFYRDLPDDLVFKVNPNFELDSLTSQLTRLVLDPRLRAAVGAEAASWAKSAFGVEAYVARLVPFLEEVARLTPTLRAAAHFGHLFSELGLQPNDPAVERVATTLEALFIKNNDGKMQPTKTLEASRDTARPACAARQPGHLEQKAMALSQPHARPRLPRISNVSPRLPIAARRRGGSIRLNWATACSRRGRSGWRCYAAKLEWLQLPEDLTGQSFLDLGSWDGFYAFEAEQRGAARVLATHSLSWNGSGWGNKQGFLLAREILRSKVEDMDIDIMDVCPERLGLFDVVRLQRFGVSHARPDQGDSECGVGL